MSLFNKRFAKKQENDSNLVMYSLGGDRDAFCLIVSRYQNLLCSLAYAAVGDLKQSEDLAQDTFVDAWRKLETLQDPEKLKAWLCGILRFKISHFKRKENTQPVANAEELDELAPTTNHESNLEKAVILQQESALVWQVLDNIDETYRVPLILFYREQQSIERVAEELDISSATAKQRLSRGRKLLKLAMTNVVEESLSRSKPGVAFTAGVMAVISQISPPAKAAAWGASALKTGSAFKFTSIFAFLAVFSGLISSFLGLRAGLDQSRTVNERRLVIRCVVSFIGVAFIFTVIMFGLKPLAANYQNFSFAISVFSQVVVLAFVLSYWLLVRWMFTAMKTLRAHERIFSPEAFKGESKENGKKQREYISAIKIFGVPIFHFQLGMPEQSDKPAFGWFAGGSYARGLIFAWGGVAIAPISVGIVSFGVLTVGAIGVGVFSMGTVAIGILAFGASALAYKAYASLSSLGWESAFSNGFSMAKDAAIGPFAYAEYVNNQQAAKLATLTSFEQIYPWALLVLSVLVIGPAIVHARTVRRRMKQTYDE